MLVALLPCEPPLGPDALQPGGADELGSDCAGSGRCGADLDLPQRRAVRGPTAALHVAERPCSRDRRAKWSHISDVPPGQYAITVDSYGVPYPNQFAEFNLGAGQEAFVKVLSMSEKVGGEFGVGTRTRLFTPRFPSDAARSATSTTPFSRSRLSLLPGLP